MVKDRFAQEKNAKPLGMNFHVTHSYYNDDETGDDDPSDLPRLEADDDSVVQYDNGNGDVDSSEWSWDPGEVDDDGTQLINDTGRELLPDPERDVSEDEALEIVNFATSYRNTRKGLRNAQTGRNYLN